MQEKIQVKNIFFWLKIIPFVMFICNLNSVCPQAPSNALNVIILVLRSCFSPVFVEVIGLQQQRFLSEEYSLTTFLLQKPPIHVVLFRYCISKLLIETNILW